MYYVAGRPINDQSSVLRLETGDRRLETKSDHRRFLQVFPCPPLRSVRHAHERGGRGAVPRTTDDGRRTTDDGKRGFTLLEVVVAMAVLAVAMVSLLGLYQRNLQQTIQNQRLNVAMLLGQGILTRTQLEGGAVTPRATGDFAELHPGQYPEFRWQRTVHSTPLAGLWEVRVAVSWGERADEVCELTLFTPLEGL
jgi:general secretion pathway protein I